MALPACTPREKILGQRIAPGIDAVDFSNLLDEKPQRRINEVLIELALAKCGRQRDLSNFARHTGAEAEGGPDQSFGQRQEIRLDGHRLFIASRYSASASS